MLSLGVNIALHVTFTFAFSRMESVATSGSKIGSGGRQVEFYVFVFNEIDEHSVRSTITDGTQTRNHCLSSLEQRDETPRTEEIN